MNLEELDNLEEKIRKIKFWRNMSGAEIFQICGLWSWRKAKIANIGKDTVLGRKIKQVFAEYADELEAELKKLGVEYENK
ncbi:hypothetical protein U5M32_05990 [Streptococcus sp. TATVAM-FAB35]|uniref:hypothetical protein n=1 Tax=Streptococcus TaxID=1301 RepID=UPI00397EC727